MKVNVKIFYFKKEVILGHFSWSIHHEVLKQCKGQLILSKYGGKKWKMRKMEWFCSHSQPMLYS